MKSYRICEIGVRVFNDNAYQFYDVDYNLFLTNSEKSCELTIKFAVCNHMLDVPDKYLSINTTNMYFDVETQEYIQWDKCMLKNDGRKCLSWMVADADWSVATVYLTEPSMPLILEKNYIVTAFCSRLSHNDGLIMHSSFVEHEGSAVIFTASSGVGKSTHADLWKNYFDDQIINGDRAAIRFINNGIYAYGLPWSGSSPYIVNKKLPLAAIIVLEQASENSIIKLNALESIEYCATHCYYPTWDTKLTSMCMDTLDEVLKRTPVYLLKCKPELEAAVLVRDTVFPK